MNPGIKFNGVLLELTSPIATASWQLAPFPPEQT